MSEARTSDFEWPMHRLGDDATIKGRIGWKGYTKADLVEEGPWVIGGAEVKSFLHLDLSEAKHLTREKYEESPEIMLKEGDVLLATRGNLADCAYIDDSIGEATINPSLIVLGDFKGNPKYLFYYLASTIGRANVLSLRSGSSVPAIYQAHVKELRYPAPPIEVQNEIAEILGALDDMIELNRRMNGTLEALAQAVFKEWFVEKAEEGWEEVPFARTVKVYVGGTPKTSVKEYWGGDIPWFAIADAGPRDVFVVDTERKVTQAGIDNSSAQVVPKGTTILTARGTVGQTVLTGLPMAMNQSCFGLWGVHDRFGYYTYFQARELAKQFQQYSHGSVFSTINRSTFETLETRLPDKDAVTRFEDVVQPMMERILGNINESRTLTTLRDTLLPKLMRGEVRVKAVHRAVDA